MFPFSNPKGEGEGRGREGRGGEGEWENYHEICYLSFIQ